jgi:uncharacterized membrane protein YdbT with pleckstrin-like domain
MLTKLFGKEWLKELGNKGEVLKIIHRHWFDILKQFIVIFLLVLLLIFLFSFIPSYFPAFEKNAFSNLLLFAENLVAIFIWIFIFFIWIDYYFDIWIIASEKIVNIEQKGLFVRSVSELKFERIQDVTVEVNGFIPTILNYGDVYIQTAGETERFIFRQVPDPYGLKDLIMGLQKEQIAEETNELGEVIRKEINR